MSDGHAEHHRCTDIVAVIEVLTGTSPRARDLRLINPFGELLEAHERDELAASFWDCIEQPSQRGK